MPPTSSQDGEGSVPEVNPLALLPVLADFIRLKDPNMLALEVFGLINQYPDIRFATPAGLTSPTSPHLTESVWFLSEEHVSVLLDIRGDISRDVRGTVLNLLEQSSPPLPAGYRPIFTDILVRPSTMAFCLPTTKCT